MSTTDIYTLSLHDALPISGIEIGVLAEVDVGLGRVGVPPGETLLRLIQDSQRLPGLRFDGIAFYPGQIKSLDEEGEQALKSLAQMLERILDDLRKAGMEARIVSGGSTPRLVE